MKVGEIYKWETTKARGHEKRYKYHVFIGTDEQNRSVFLFINSLNPYNEDFELKKSDYPFFTKPSSYICCTSVAYYNAAQTSHLAKDSHKGTLKKSDMQKLHDHIVESEVLEQYLIDFICACLIAASD